MEIPMLESQTQVVGSLQFLTPQTESSLYRNNKVLMVRNDQGSFVRGEGVQTEKQLLPIYDARQLSEADAMTLDINGFELVDAPVPAYDFMDHQEVIIDYYRDCEKLVARMTGAKAWAFDHNIRSVEGQSAGLKVKGGQDVQGPAHIVHGDYTLRSAPERLQQLAKAPSVNDTLREVIPPGSALLPQESVDCALADNGRFAIINVWRNIAFDPVATHPLALCDGRFVEPEDLVVFEIHMSDRIGENYWSKYHDRHRFYSYPEMIRNEALLIKQWDSAGELARSAGRNADRSSNGPCTFSFHSAFIDPTTPEDAPDRWSIEVRCIVIYD